MSPVSSPVAASLQAGTAAAAAAATALRAEVPTLYDRRRYLRFFAEDFHDPTSNRWIEVLSGDQPPTVVGGYATWTPVNRPLRADMQVFTGYTTPSIQFALRFMVMSAQGSWDTSRAAGEGVEQACLTLGWMAGAQHHVGPSPLVYPTSYDAHGVTTPLVPPEYQNGSPAVAAALGEDTLPWVVTALTWDPAPIRRADDYRIRQDATLTLSLYDTPAGQQLNTLVRPRGFTVSSHSGEDTSLLIARQVASNNVEKLALNIVAATRNQKLNLRSVNQLIKHGRGVYVPSSRAG